MPTSPRKSASPPSRRETAPEYEVYYLAPAFVAAREPAMLGYLVAPAGNPSRPIALCVTPGGMDDETALTYALRISDDPTGSWADMPRVGDDEEAVVVDLTARAETEPLPAWLFGARAWRVNESGGFLHRHPVELWPWCEVRVGRWVDSLTDDEAAHLEALLSAREVIARRGLGKAGAR